MDYGVSLNFLDLERKGKERGYMCLSEANNGSRINKKLKKKRSFAVLKEEEEIILKERIRLNRELASLHVTLKQQKARSENLKRIEFDLNRQSSETRPGSSKAEAMVSEGCYGVELFTVNSAQSVLSRHSAEDEHTISNSCWIEVEANKKHCFIVPDLNMMPKEEEISTEVL